MLKVHQPEYPSNLREILKYVNLDLFCSTRTVVSWISHSRQDIFCAVNRSSQVTEDTSGQ